MTESVPAYWLASASSGDPSKDPFAKRLNTQGDADLFEEMGFNVWSVSESIVPLTEKL